MSLFNRLFKFRKFRSTLAEELEDLHTESLSVQQNLVKSRLLQQKWTKTIALYVLVAYLSLNIFYFTFFLSNDNITRIYTFVTSVILGALLYGFHRLIGWYFRIMIQKKEDRLKLFKDRKQELIEEVKNKETYTVAKTILEKYGETIPSDFRPTPIEPKSNELRQRVTVRPMVPGSDKPVVSGPPPNIGTLETFNRPKSENQASNGVPVNMPLNKLPREILPPESTIWGSILNFIVGDGPSKRLICDERLHERWKFRFRYALICKNCNSHNGMALEEEFEYLSFRCAYCNYLNNARKHKPVFHHDIVTEPTTNEPQSKTTLECTISSSSESSINNEENTTNDTNMNEIHRSIIVPASEDTNPSPPRSPSAEHRPIPSSTEEN